MSKPSFSSLRWHRKAGEGAHPTHARPPSSRPNGRTWREGLICRPGRKGQRRAHQGTQWLHPQPQPERRPTSPEVGPTPNVGRRKRALLGRGVEATVWRARLDSGRGDGGPGSGPPNLHLRGPGCPRQLLSPLHAQDSAWWVSAQLLGCRPFPRFVPSRAFRAPLSTDKLSAFPASPVQSRRLNLLGMFCLKKEKRCYRAPALLV